MHVPTASVGVGERDTHAVQIHSQLLMVLFFLYDIEKSSVNAGEKLVRHRHFFR
jgi:hypothetical protein